MKKIIIDTDPGIDDALALGFALYHPNLEVMGLTTIFGNVSAGLATENALRLCELTGQSVSVAQGADSPLHIAPNQLADFVHGKNGFGNIELPVPKLKASTLSAAELIVSVVEQHPGEVTIVAVGPLTNIALALQLSPAIAGKVAEVVIMGGAFHCDGNVTAYAEANIWNDPHAAQIVFNADWPIVAHGLDVTLQINFTTNYLDGLASNSPKVGGFLRDAAQFYIEFYERERKIDGCCPHDLLALAYVTNPEWFTLESGAIAVATDGKTLGNTTINTSVKTNKQIATSVMPEELLENYAAVLKLAS